MPIDVFAGASGPGIIAGVGSNVGSANPTGLELARQTAARAAAIVAGINAARQAAVIAGVTAATIQAATRTAAQGEWRNVTGSADGYSSQEPGILDRVASALNPVTQAGSAIARAAADSAANLNAGIEAAKAAARAGGANAVEALKFLADNGDFFAKIALGLGVGYVAAMGLLAAGGVLVLVLLLKK